MAFPWLTTLQGGENLNRVRTLKIPLTAATTTDGGAVCSVANPEGVNLLVLRLVVDLTSGSTGVATIDFGISDEGPEASADGLIDGLAVQGNALIVDNFTNPGTNGRQLRRWSTEEYFTGTASATLAGLVGVAHIEYIRA